MIGKSYPEYVFIRACILGLRLVAPTSAAYLLASFARGDWIISSYLGFYATIEFAFYIFVFLPRKYYLQKAGKHPLPLLDRAARQALFKRCAYDIGGNADFSSKWFFDTDVQRQNVVDWLLWSLFSSEPRESLEEWKDELDDYVNQIEDMLGRKLGHGYNKNARSMRLTFDPVRMVHRPLIWYAIVALVDNYTFLRIFACGFHHFASPAWFQSFPPRPITTLLSRRSVDPQISYWYRPHASKSKLPILFLHGIGIGLYPYIPFFKEIIAQDPDVGILAIEILPISMRITGPPLCRKDMCNAVSKILASLRLSRVVVASHSYGTVVAAQLIHSPDLDFQIAAVLLVDPIPILLHLPNIAYNFVYRKPQSANEWQLWYFASRDPDISRTLSRHFFWSENVMWKDELEGKRVAVSLSGADQIVHAEEVRRYLTGEEEVTAQWSKDGLDVLFFKGLDHAMVFDTPERRRPLIEVITQFVRSG